MALRSISRNSRGGDCYARKQWQERKQDLKFLDSAHESMGMSLAEYRSCRHALLSAIHELETLLNGTKQESARIEGQRYTVRGDR